MEILLLLLLFVVAGALFLPELLKERTLDSPLHTVTDFHRGMNALALSTHDADRGGVDGSYYYTTYGQNESEPYVRRSRYEDHSEAYHEDIIPYPINRARVQMEQRRHRIIAILLVVEFTASIIALLSTVTWMVPVAIALNVITAGYICLTILLPGRRVRR